MMTRVFVLVIFGLVFASRLVAQEQVETPNITINKEELRQLNPEEKALVQEFLQEHFPDHKSKIISKALTRIGTCCPDTPDATCCTGGQSTASYTSLKDFAHDIAKSATGLKKSD